MNPPNSAPGPTAKGRAVTLTLALGLAALIIWWVAEFNLLLIAWVGGALGLLLLAVLTGAAWRKGLRWLFSRPALRFYLWVVAGLISVVLLFYAEENWRGQRSWARLQRELAARGESVELDAIIPGPVPDEQNFAKAPGVSAALGLESTNSETFFLGDPHDWPKEAWTKRQLTSLARWQSLLGTIFTNETIAVASDTNGIAANILSMLRRFDTPIEALRAAAARPHCRYPFNYEDTWGGLSRNTLDNLYNAGSVLRLRACAELQAGQPEASLQDVLLLLRLADTLKEEPVAIAQRLRLELMLLALQPVWEGVATGRWGQSQLLSLQERFSTMQPRTGFDRVAKGETILMMHLGSQFEAYLAGQPSAVSPHLDNSHGADAFGLWLFKAFYPKGWLAQDRVWLYRFYQKYGSQEDERARQALNNRRWRAELRRIMDPCFLFYALPRVVEVLQDSTSWVPYAEVIATQASTACALERFTEENSAFPETLAPLTPKYLAGLPADPCSGAHDLLRYRASSDGYWLYSIGANQIDDGGAISEHHEYWGRTRSLAPVLQRADWVWALPPISRSTGE